MAIGYYDHPNLIGVPGEDLPHVQHYYAEPHLYYRQRVVIVGGGNSAAEAALECYRAGAHVTLVHRWPELKASIKYWVKPDIENRIKEGSIAARFNTCVTEIRPTSVVVRTAGAEQDEELPADTVLLLTGYRSDSNLLRRRRRPAERAMRADLQRRDVRNQRARPVRRRRRSHRPGHEQHLHRERPLPRREDCAGDCRPN